VIDRLLAEAHGLTPPDVDRLTLRDMAVMVHAAVRKKRQVWQRTAELASKVHNLGGPRSKDFTPKPPNELYPNLFTEELKTWEERMEEKFSNYNPD
jgi:hypothetical protein